jgi:hypothetical protein
MKFKQAVARKSILARKITVNRITGGSSATKTLTLTINLKFSSPDRQL